MMQNGSARVFLGFMGLLNVAVGVMFFTVNIKIEPPVAVTVASVTSQPSPQKPQITPAVVGTPKRIVIQSLSIDLGVGTGSYNPADNSWTLGGATAYYADISLPVNDSNGTTLVYGHAQPQVFGRLPQIQPQAEAAVYTDNGYVFHYQYESVKNVPPTDTSVLTATGAPTLVLQTCAGDWDAYRALFSFALLSKEKL